MSEINTEVITANPRTRVAMDVPPPPMIIHDSQRENLEDAGTSEDCSSIQSAANQNDPAKWPTEELNPCWELYKASLESKGNGEAPTLPGFLKTPYACRSCRAYLSYEYVEEWHRTTCKPRDEVRYGSKLWEETLPKTSTSLVTPGLEFGQDMSRQKCANKKDEIKDWSKNFIPWEAPVFAHTNPSKKRQVNMPEQDLRYWSTLGPVGQPRLYTEQRYANSQPPPQKKSGHKRSCSGSIKH